MKAFAEYVGLLDRLIRQSSRIADTQPQHTSSVAAALDGEPARELRRLVPLAAQRRWGAFFTGSKLAERALGAVRPSITLKSRVLDPAVGAGDLLVAIASTLRPQGNLAETIAKWSPVFGGCDVKSTFVAATKRRLALSAIRNGATGFVDSLDQSFPGIRVQDGLDAAVAVESATHLVMNPPFTLLPAPEWCDWARGKINFAAVFVQSCLEQANVGTRLIAILPEVLRGGSRYEPWRRLVQSRLDIHRVESCGLFDQWADVDVFILDGYVSATPCARSGEYWIPATSSIRLVDRFEISVGPVVDYRDPRIGNWRPFVSARTVAPWEEVEASKHRRYSGRLVAPPFVVIRRTSRPGDRFRAVGTIIRGNAPVAVENHLLVLVPHSRTLRDCRALLKQLQTESTNDWLNARICCRHLTVVAMRDFPWSEP